MTRTEHLSTIAMEECNEVAQRVSKAMRFGMHEVQPNGDDGIHPPSNPEGLDNHARIRRELGDLLGALDMLDVIDLDAVGDAELRRFGREKIAKVERFLMYSSTCGTLS